MSVLLFIVGAGVVMIGVGMVGYGIPINEFSFGNTLIVGGTTAVVGGLIIIAIGVAVGQLRRINQALATHMPVRPGLPVEMPEPAAAAAPSRVPFPPKPKSEPVIPEPQPPEETAVEDHPAVAAAPTLQNPDRPAAAVEEFKVEEYEVVSLSPRQAVPAPAPVELDGRRRRRSPTMFFRWPECARSRPSRRHGILRRRPHRRRSANLSQAISTPCGRRKSGRRNVLSSMRPSWSRSRTVAPAPMPAAPSEPVAILKSGVVDGMAYTLYVDGSIEAELPQGTLHFASINELRDHLAKNS